MESHVPARSPRRTAVAAGLLVLGLTLAGCSGAGSEDPRQSAPATSPGPSTASATAEASETPAASASAEASGSAGGPDAGAEEAEGVVAEAIRSVLGEDAHISTGAELAGLLDSAQGLQQGATVTPAECGPQELGGASGALPEDTHLVGGILVDLEDPASPTTDVLSVMTFPDAEAAGELLAGVREYADTCPSFTADLGQGQAEATLTVEPVDADADDALSLTTGLDLALEGTEMPEGAGSTSSTALYVQDGERVISYSGSRGGGETVPSGDALATVDSLRAALTG